MTSQDDAVALSQWIDRQELLERAAKTNDPAKISRLLSQGAEPAEASRPGGESALRTALRSGSHEALMALVESMDRPCAEPDGSTPLMWAAHLGDERAVELLLPCCDLVASLASAGTALILGAHQSPFLVAKLIKGSDVNAVNGKKRSALHQAAIHGSPETVEMLLAAGAKPLVDLHGNTPLMAVIKQGGPNSMSAIVKLGAHVNSAGSGRRTPLMVAAQTDSFEAIQWLLDAGADPMAKSSLGETALMFAAEAASPRCVALLAGVCDPLALGRRRGARGSAKDFAKRRGLLANEKILESAEQQARSNMEHGKLSRAAKPSPVKKSKPRL